DQNRRLLPFGEVDLEPHVFSRDAVIARDGTRGYDQIIALGRPLEDGPLERHLLAGDLERGVLLRARRRLIFGALAAALGRDRTAECGFGAAAGLNVTEWERRQRRQHASLRAPLQVRDRLILRRRAVEVGRIDELPLARAVGRERRRKEELRPL